MAARPAAFKHNTSAADNSITVLVNIEASGHYIDDFIIPSLKHRLWKYVLLTTPRKILTAEGALLDGTTERIFQSLVTDHHGKQHLARIDILIVPA